MLTLEIVLVDLTHWYINSVNSMALCDAAAVAIVPLMLCKCFTMNTEYSSFSRQIWFFSNHILWEVFFYFWASPLTTMDAVFASFSCSMWWRHMIAGLVWAPSVCSCCRFNQTDFIYSNMWRENKIEEKKRNRNQSTFKGVGKLSALQVCAHWVECRIHIEHSAPSFAIRHVSSSAPLSILRAHMTVNLHADRRPRPRISFGQCTNWWNWNGGPSAPSTIIFISSIAALKLLMSSPWSPSAQRRT